MYPNARVLPSAQHRKVFHGVLSYAVQYFRRAIRSLSSSAFMTASTAWFTLCGWHTCRMPFRTLALRVSGDGGE